MSASLAPKQQLRLACWSLAPQKVATCLVFHWKLGASPINLAAGNCPNWGTQKGDCSGCLTTGRLSQPTSAVALLPPALG